MGAQILLLSPREILHLPRGSLCNSLGDFAIFVSFSYKPLPYLLAGSVCVQGRTRPNKDQFTIILGQGIFFLSDPLQINNSSQNKNFHKSSTNAPLATFIISSCLDLRLEAISAHTSFVLSSSLRSHCGSLHLADKKLALTESPTFFFVPRRISFLPFSVKSGTNISHKSHYVSIPKEEGSL